jgi:hypothetical protein
MYSVGVIGVFFVGFGLYIRFMAVAFVEDGCYRYPYLYCIVDRVPRGDE